VTYALAAADTDTAGEYVMQARVTLSDGTVVSWPPTDSPESRLVIRASLASLG